MAIHHPTATVSICNALGGLQLDRRDAAIIAEMLVPYRAPRSPSGSSTSCAASGPREAADMATIRRRAWLDKNGVEVVRFQVDFVDQHGKRRHKQFPKRKDADHYLTTVKYQVRQGTYSAPSESLTVAEAVEQWLEHARTECDAQTVRTYECVASNHIVHARAREDRQADPARRSSIGSTTCKAARCRTARNGRAAWPGPRSSSSR